MGTDNSKRQTKRDADARRLLRVLRAGSPDVQFHINRRAGVIAVDSTTLAQVVVEDPDSSAVEWGRWLAQNLHVDTAPVEQQWNVRATRGSGVELQLG